MLKPLSLAQTSLYISFFEFAVLDMQVHDDEQVLAWMRVHLRSKWISASAL